MNHTRHVYTPSPSETVSESVVRAVAAAKDVDPMDLDERLYDCVDPDALDRLFPCEGTVTFTMAGCRVEVEKGQIILVTDRSDDRPAADDSFDGVCELLFGLEVAHVGVSENV